MFDFIKRFFCGHNNSESDVQSPDFEYIDDNEVIRFTESVEVIENSSVKFIFRPNWVRDVVELVSSSVLIFKSEQDTDYPTCAPSFDKVRFEISQDMFNFIGKYYDMYRNMPNEPYRYIARSTLESFDCEFVTEYIHYRLFDCKFCDNGLYCAGNKYFIEIEPHSIVQDYLM